MLKPPKGLNGGPGYPVPYHQMIAAILPSPGKLSGQSGGLLPRSAREADATREMLRRFFLEHQITITEEVIE